MNGYYSVFDPSGMKIADCGALRDAVNLVGMRGEGHYYQFKPVYQTIDVEPFPQNQLPTRDIVVNVTDIVDCIEVGGEKIPIQQLPQDCKEPFIPDFHD